jgi:hypothetical protein
MTFRVGQKVVCVEDHDVVGTGVWYDDDRIARGEIYTIKRLWVDILGNPVCDLVERSRDTASNYWGFRLGYCRTRFRPIVEKKTDISIFTALLDPANHKKLENA